MRQIKKGAAPDKIKEWRTNNAKTPQNLFYGLAKFPHAEVLSALLDEQGFLCAYTLKRLCLNSSHVEHLKPQKRCKQDDNNRESSGQARQREDIAWKNMVACFPEANPPATPSYGAVKKGEWWCQVDFVSPLINGCEERFKFSSDGRISPADEADQPARITIQKIGLDDKKLCELRETAYLRAGIHRRAEQPIESIKKIEQLIAKWSKRDTATGLHTEFCVPLTQVAKEYAHFLRGRGAAK